MVITMRTVVYDGKEYQATVDGQWYYLKRDGLKDLVVNRSCLYDAEYVKQKAASLERARNTMADLEILATAISAAVNMPFHIRRN